jgi:hypothetical protein
MLFHSKYDLKFWSTRLSYITFTQILCVCIQWLKQSRHLVTPPPQGNLIALLICASSLQKYLYFCDSANWYKHWCHPRTADRAERQGVLPSWFTEEIKVILLREGILVKQLSAQNKFGFVYVWYVPAISSQLLFLYIIYLHVHFIYFITYVDLFLN